MSPLQRPFKLGSAVLPSNVFYSPLAGCSDFPFRQMAAKYRPGLMYCEMVKMDALVRHDPNTLHLLDYSPEMHPLGAQLVGNNLDVVADAAQMLEAMGFSVIDLNCGCPVDKVTKDGSGSGLLKTPRRIGDLISAMVKAVKIPVTVKIRAGWDDEHLNALEVMRIAEGAGAAAIAIHGRTRKQAYRGPADWSSIRACKEAADSIKVIGNGDVFSPEAAERMFAETGCDVVLCSRGTMGGPWLCDDIYRHFEGQPAATPRSHLQDMMALEEHFHLIRRYQSPRRALIDMRRVGCWYIKKAAHTREFRGAVSRAQCLSEVDALIERFKQDAEEQVAV
jgi:nifR3 family TIM-barrel protein